MPPDAVARWIPRGFWGRFPLLALLGAAASLGQSPVSWPFAALASLAAFGFVVRFADAPRRAFLDGLYFGAGYFASCLFWIVEPFFVDPVRHAWMAPFALAGVSVGFAMFWAFACLLGHVVAASPGSRVFATWASLALAEMLRSHVLTGFPWALPAYIWVESPVMQAAAFVGSFGLTALTILVAFLPAAGFGNRRVWAAPAASALALAAVYALGSHRLSLADRSDSGVQFVARVVQPNATQREKWLPEMIPVFFKRQLAFTGAESNIRPDVVVWPEVSLAYAFPNNSEPLGLISEAAGPETTVIVGAMRVERERFFNSLAVIAPGGKATGFYDKHHLVPFGEYLPLSGLFSRFGLRGLADQFGALGAGPGPAVLDMGNLGTAAPLICYEAIFPQKLAALGVKPDWILQITNDAWFGEISGPYQHLAQARARAVEQGLPLVRSANTGVSAVVDSYGRIVDSIPLGEAGYIDVDVPGKAGLAFYSGIVDRVLVLALLLVFGGCFAGLLRNRGRRRSF